MKYRLRLGRPLDENITGVLSSQISKASQSLKHDADRVEAIHSARKSFKQMDALLWLSAPLFNDKFLKNKRKKLKGLAKHLAQRRDADVLVATAKGLRSAFRTPANERLFNELLAFVEAHRESLDSVSELGEAKFVVKHLKALRPRFKALSLKSGTLGVILQSAASTYQLGRKAMVHAFESQHEEDFHEWRRFVQRHHRQMTFLKTLNPAEIDVRIAIASELADVLGAHHDLSVLRAAAKAHASAFSQASDVEKLGLLITKAQAKQVRRALPLGKLLYLERTKLFRGRLKAYAQKK